jgi:transcriptional regulator with XRE-family HTH domain
MYEIFDELIKQKGLSAYKVAKDTGISQTTLSDWKGGRSIPKTDKLQKIADYLGVTLDYLLGNEQKKEPTHNVQVRDEHCRSGQSKSSQNSVLIPPVGGSWQIF